MFWRNMREKAPEDCFTHQAIVEISNLLVMNDQRELHACSRVWIGQDPHFLKSGEWVTGKWEWSKEVGKVAHWIQIPEDYPHVWVRCPNASEAYDLMLSSEESPKIKHLEKEGKLIKVSIQHEQGKEHESLCKLFKILKQEFWIDGSMAGMFVDSHNDGCPIIDIEYI